MSNELFEKYSEELGLSATLTLEDLIDSHRSLRNINKKSIEDKVRELEVARELGKNQGMIMVTHGQYVEVSKIKKMTIEELVYFLRNEK